MDANSENWRNHVGSRLYVYEARTSTGFERVGQSPPSFFLFQHSCSLTLPLLTQVIYAVAPIAVIQITKSGSNHRALDQAIMSANNDNGKRKRVDTVDRTADDTDDTDDLDTPARPSKRQISALTSQQRPDTKPVGSNYGTTSSFRGSSYPFSGNPFPASNQHTEAERQA